jgi:hypothetical protein
MEQKKIKWVTVEEYSKHYLIPDTLVKDMIVSGEILDIARDQVNNKLLVNLYEKPKLKGNTHHKPVVIRGGEYYMKIYPYSLFTGSFVNNVYRKKDKMVKIGSTYYIKVEAEIASAYLRKMQEIYGIEPRTLIDDYGDD